MRAARNRGIWNDKIIADSKPAGHMTQESTKLVQNRGAKVEYLPEAGEVLLR